jgi:hypothetical protein
MEEQRMAEGLLCSGSAIDNHSAVATQRRRRFSGTDSNGKQMIAWTGSAISFSGVCCLEGLIVVQGRSQAMLSKLC